jgi:hypothetical protein
MSILPAAGFPGQPLPSLHVRTKSISSRNATNGWIKFDCEMKTLPKT